MKWATKTTLDRLAAPPNRDAITPVDAARAFWYRAMAMVMLEGNIIMEETDRMFAISLLDNVNKQDVANELVALAEDLEDKDPEIVKDDEMEINGPISYPSRRARRFADGSFAPTDIPGYNIRTWERPCPPSPQPRHQVTDGGMQFLFSRINPMKGAPERFPGTILACRRSFGRRLDNATKSYTLILPDGLPKKYRMSVSAPHVLDKLRAVPLG
ncbi:hypothetical protein IWX90DRAFT_487408 [Phyllosticta citrichinensis]|uniref:Uncharacterized protein n=1 Tax=Phyllosticta citrichinensis TaxID=1130410 RepID=A0ABR1XR52_9PEZI